MSEKAHITWQPDPRTDRVADHGKEMPDRDTNWYFVGECAELPWVRFATWHSTNHPKDWKAKCYSGARLVIDLAGEKCVHEMWFGQGLETREAAELIVRLCLKARNEK